MREKPQANQVCLSFPAACVLEHKQLLMEEQEQAQGAALR